MLWHVLISLAEDSHFSCALTVSDAEPSPDDSQYIRQLRQRYGIPLCYVYWPRDAQTISQRELMKCVRAIKISG